MIAHFTNVNQPNLVDLSNSILHIANNTLFIAVASVQQDAHQADKGKQEGQDNQQGEEGIFFHLINFSFTGE